MMSLNSFASLSILLLLLQGISFTEMAPTSIETSNDTSTDPSLDIKCEGTSYSNVQISFVSIALILIILGTAIGNFLVILAVGLVKKLQTPSNLLIVSLAFSDFLVALLVLPFSAIATIGGHWPFNESLCDMYISMDVLLCTSSILNLTAISIDRYLVITKPLEYAVRRTPSLMTGFIAGAWILSALISIPPNFGWKTPFKPCQCEYSEDIGYQFYATICAFYIPLFVMLVLYGRIFKLAREMSKADKKQNLQSNTEEDEMGNQIDQENPDASQLVQLTDNANKGNSKADTDSLQTKFKSKRSTSGQQNKKHKSNSESKAIKTLGVIMGCFCLCWLPFFIIQIVKTVMTACNIQSGIPGSVFQLLLWLGYLNSFLNPIIYAKFNQEFRQPFKLILLCQCRNINARLRSETYAAQYGLPTSSSMKKRKRNTPRRINEAGMRALQK